MLRGVRRGVVQYVFDIEGHRFEFCHLDLVLGCIAKPCSLTMVRKAGKGRTLKKKDL